MFVLVVLLLMLEVENVVLMRMRIRVLWLLTGSLEVEVVGAALERA